MTDDRKKKREERNQRLTELAQKGQAAGLWTVTNIRADLENWGAWADLKDPEGGAFILRAEDDGRLYGDLARVELPWAGAEALVRSSVRVPAAPFQPPSFGAGQDSLALLRAIKRRLLEPGRPWAQAIQDEYARRVDSRCRLEAQARELQARGWRAELTSSYYSGRCWSQGDSHLSGSFDSSGRVTLERVVIRRVDLLADLLPLLEGAK